MENVSFLPVSPSDLSLWHARCQDKLWRSNKHLRGMQPLLSCPQSSAVSEPGYQLLPMQSSMKNQRSSPASPCFFTSTRQALYLALLALHLAFISLSFSIVSFTLDGLAVAGAAVVAAGAAAGAVVWAEAVWSVPATSSMAARQIPVRSIGKFPWVSR